MSSYTSGQRKAYYSGMGYRVAYEGKGINFKKKKNRESFRAGFNAATVPIKLLILR